MRSNIEDQSEAVLRHPRMKAIGVRLPAMEEVRLRRLADARLVGISDIVREALRRYMKDQD